MLTLSSRWWWWWWWWWWCKVIFVSNPTKVMLGWVEVGLVFFWHNFSHSLQYVFSDINLSKCCKRHWPTFLHIKLQIYGGAKSFNTGIYLLLYVSYCDTIEMIWSFFGWKCGSRVFLHLCKCGEKLLPSLEICNLAERQIVQIKQLPTLHVYLRSEIISFHIFC